MDRKEVETLLACQYRLMNKRLEALEAKLDKVLEMPSAEKVIEMFWTKPILLTKANLDKSEQWEQSDIWTRTQMDGINKRLKTLDSYLNKLLETERKARKKELEEKLEERSEEREGYEAKGEFIERQIRDDQDLH